jgi:uncharacterized protein (UPF0332 family)
VKQELDNDSIEALVAYRIQRAKETLLEAEILIKGSFFNAAVNRLYYACYYAVIALLVRHRVPAQTHAGVKQMLGLYFVVKGKLSAKFGRFYTQLFNYRMTGDYDDFVVYDKEMLDELLPRTEEFIQVIEELANKES